MKKILAIILSVTLLFSVFSMQGIIANATATTNNLDCTFDFNSESEVIKYTNSAIEDGKLVMNDPEIGTGDRLLAILNYKLESNKTYCYELKMNVIDVGNGKSTQAGLYTASATTPSTKLVYFMPNCNASGYAKPVEGERVISGQFTTGDVGTSNYLSFNFWDTSGLKIEFDYIKIYEPLSSPYSDEHVFDFNYSKDVNFVSNSNYAKVENGDLVIGSTSTGIYDQRVILPFVLDDNSTYTYVINYKNNIASTKSGKYQIFAAASNSVPSSITALSHWYDTGSGTWGKLNLHTDLYSKSGTFSTGSLSTNNYFALNVDPEAQLQVVYIDSIEIYKHKTYSGEHTFEFTKPTDVLNTTGTTSGNSVEISNGKLNISNNIASTSTSDQYSDTLIRLPYKLESNTEYNFEVKYSSDSAKSSLFRFLYSKSSSANNGTKLAYINGSSWASLAATTDKTVLATATTETVTADTTDMLCLQFQIMSKEAAQCNVSIEYIKIYKTVAQHTGEYVFNFDSGLNSDVTHLSNAKIEDGNLILHKGSEGNLVTILNYKLESNKTYVYKINGTVGDAVTTPQSVRALFKTASKTATVSTLWDIMLQTPDAHYIVPTTDMLCTTGAFKTGDILSGEDYLALEFYDYGGREYKIESIEISEKKAADKPSVSAEIISANGKNITMKSVSGCEYSFDGKNWKDSPVLEGYGFGTITFMMRVKETKINYCSEAVTVDYTVNYLGDVNGDDYINASDLTGMRIYLLTDGGNISLTGTDVNADANFDIRDLVALKKLLVSSTQIVGESGIKYNLVVSDDFSGNDLKTALWKNSPAYTRTVSGKSSVVDCIDTSVSNGVLSIGTSLDEDGVYHGGEIISTNKFSHGYFEAKVKLPAGSGYFPAFWGKLGSSNYGEKAYGNEIDFFESYASDSVYSPAIHLWYDKDSTNLPDWIKNADQELNWVEEGHFGLSHNNSQKEKLLSDTYHIFSCEWTTDRLSFYLDGEKYYEQSFDGQYSDYYTALIEGEPIYIYLSNLVGVKDTLPGDNIGNSFDIEYFRYYAPVK